MGQVGAIACCFYIKLHTGITNYFKFLKWLFWIFVILSLVYLPMLVINTFGKGQEQSVALNDLSQTMVSCHRYIGD